MVMILSPIAAADRLQLNSFEVSRELPGNQRPRRVITKSGRTKARTRIVVVLTKFHCGELEAK